MSLSDLRNFLSYIPDVGAFRANHASLWLRYGLAPDKLDAELDTPGELDAILGPNPRKLVRELQLDPERLVAEVQKFLPDQGEVTFRCTRGAGHKVFRWELSWGVVPAQFFLCKFLQFKELCEGTKASTLAFYNKTES